jgi:hypothetical protein
LASHPLDGCFERIIRATLHKDTLQADLRAETSDPDFGPTFKVDMHKKRFSVAVICEEDFFLPPRLGVIFGDAIHNLHASLDNLVFELGKLDNTTPGHDSHFPILNSANEWFADDTLRALAYVRPHDRTRIELHQPFMQVGIAPKDHVLARIRRYSNEGKHRVMTPIAGGVGEGVLESLETTDVRVTSAQPFITKPLRKDAVVAEFALELTGPHPNVKVSGKIGWYAALEDDMTCDVITFLETAIAYVHNLLVDFRDNAF